MGNSATVCKMAEGDADIALIGLAVMGQNLILNMNDHGFKVVAYNRTTSKVDDFLNNEAKGTNVVGAHSLEEMVGKLKRPRRVMILVKAGAAVDAFIDKLVPLLEKVTNRIKSFDYPLKIAGRYHHRRRELGVPGLSEANHSVEREGNSLRWIWGLWRRGGGQVRSFSDAWRQPSCLASNQTNLPGNLCQIWGGAML